MKKQLKELGYEISSKYGYKYPKNVENQINRFYENYSDNWKRKLIYEYIILEWIIASKNKLLHFN